MVRVIRVARKRKRENRERKSEGVDQVSEKLRSFHRESSLCWR